MRVREVQLFRGPPVQGCALNSRLRRLKELESSGLIETERRGKFVDVTFCRDVWKAYLKELKSI